jgi:hypothetical protein
MAIRTISDAGGNWNDTATWVEGIVANQYDNVVAQSDGSSGNLTLYGSSAYCIDLDLSNYTGTLTFNSRKIFMTGSLIFSAAMTVVATSSSSAIYFSTGTGNITTNGKVLYNVSIHSGTWTLQDALTCTSAINVDIAATFNTNNYNITSKYLYAYSGSTINFGTSTIVTSVLFSISPTSTIDASNCTITVTDGGGFVGGNKTYNIVKFTGSNSILWDSNTIADLRLTDGTPETRTIQFHAGSRQIITANFQALGDATHTVTIKSTTNGTGYTVQKTYSGAQWNVGSNSTDSGGNTDLTFAEDTSGKMDYCDIRDLGGELLSGIVLTESITVTDDKPLKSFVDAGISESITLTEVVSKYVPKQLSDSITMSDTYSRGQILLSLIEYITFSENAEFDAHTTNQIKTLSETIALSEGINRDSARSFGDVISIAELAARGRSYTIDDIISMHDSIQMWLRKADVTNIWSDIYVAGGWGDLGWGDFPWGNPGAAKDTWARVADPVNTWT